LLPGYKLTKGELGGLMHVKSSIVGSRFKSAEPFGAATMNADFRRWAIACLYVVGFGIAGALLLQHWMHLPVLLPYLIF
jgi:hypothetical protein